jgi:hypothetical protein
MPDMKRLGLGLEPVGEEDAQARVPSTLQDPSGNELQFVQYPAAA